MQEVAVRSFVVVIVLVLMTSSSCAQEATLEMVFELKKMHPKQWTQPRESAVISALSDTLQVRYRDFVVKGINFHAENTDNSLVLLYLPGLSFDEADAAATTVESKFQSYQRQRDVSFRIDSTTIRRKQSSDSVARSYTVSSRGSDDDSETGWIVATVVVLCIALLSLLLFFGFRSSRKAEAHRKASLASQLSKPAERVATLRTAFPLREMGMYWV